MSEKIYQYVILFLNAAIFAQVYFHVTPGILTDFSHTLTFSTHKNSYIKMFLAVCLSNQGYYFEFDFYQKSLQIV